MYSILNMTWDDVMASDLIFKSNAIRKTIEFNANEFDDVSFSESTILVVYNPASSQPMIMCERVLMNVDVDIDRINSEVEDFVGHVDHIKVGNKDATDIVFTRRNLYDAIMEEQISQ